MNRQPLKVSLVIRAINEENTIPQLFEIIQKQTLPPNEIILVDNESSDKTVQLALKHKSKVVSISKSDFSHPKSCNLAMEKAINNLVIFTNGHSYPISNTWIEDGLKHFSDTKVAGIYAIPLLDSRASIWEIIISKIFRFIDQSDKLKIYSKQQLIMGGLMSTTSAIVRKDLWKLHPFNEQMINGGEDTEWGLYFLRKNYKIVEEPKFSVFHCHGDSFLKLLNRQLTYAWTYIESVLQIRKLIQN